MLRVLAGSLCCMASIAVAGSAHPLDKRVKMNECHNAGLFAFSAAAERDGGKQLPDVLDAIESNAENYPNAYYVSLTKAIVRYSFARPEESPPTLAVQVQKYCEKQLGEMSEDETTW